MPLLFVYVPLLQQKTSISSSHNFLPFWYLFSWETVFSRSISIYSIKCNDPDGASPWKPIFLSYNTPRHLSLNNGGRRAQKLNYSIECSSCSLFVEKIRHRRIKSYTFTCFAYLMDLIDLLKHFRSLYWWKSLNKRTFEPNFCILFFSTFLSTGIPCIYLWIRIFIPSV